MQIQYNSLMTSANTSTAFRRGCYTKAWESSETTRVGWSFNHVLPTALRKIMIEVSFMLTVDKRSWHMIIDKQSVKEAIIRLQKTTCRVCSFPVKPTINSEKLIISLSFLQRLDSSSLAVNESVSVSLFQKGMLVRHTKVQVCFQKAFQEPNWPYPSSFPFHSTSLAFEVSSSEGLRRVNALESGHGRETVRIMFPSFQAEQTVKSFERLFSLRYECWGVVHGCFV